MGRGCVDHGISEGFEACSSFGNVIQYVEQFAELSERDGLAL